MTSAPKVFFPNLDGLRTLAFLMVFFQHSFLNTFAYLHIHNIFLQKFITMICDGGTGVSIFFVLSGFLITYLLLAESERYGKIHPGYFYLRRTLRIWPLYYVVITFVFFGYPWLKSLIGVPTNLGSRPGFYYVFLSNFDVIHIQKNFPGLDSSSGNITWSVAIEEQFYLVWPLLFLFTPKKLYKFIFYSIIAISLIFRCVNRDDGVVLYFHTLSVFSNLALGGLCAYYSLYSHRFKLFFEKLKKRTVFLIYGAGITWLYFYTDIFRSDILRIFSSLISAFFFAFIILEQNYARRSVLKFSKIKSFTFWGKYTYGLYLLHPIAITLLDDLLRMLHISAIRFVTSFSMGIAALLLSLLMSYLSYEYFESRFLKLKDRFTFIGRGRTAGIRSVKDL